MFERRAPVVVLVVIDASSEPLVIVLVVCASAGIQAVRARHAKIPQREIIFFTNNFLQEFGETALG